MHQKELKWLLEKELFKQSEDIMNLTGKQKRYLRSQAHHLTPIFQIGKSGITEEMLKQINEALVKRELFKISLLQNTMVTPQEAAEMIEEKLDANVVQIIGKILVVFKASPKEKYQEISNAVAKL